MAPSTHGGKSTMEITNEWATVLKSIAILQLMYLLVSILPVVMYEHVVCVCVRSVCVCVSVCLCVCVCVCL